MKYIEIAQNLSIRVDEIEAVTSGDNGMTSVVITHHNRYDSTFPYSVLLELLETREEEPREQQQLNILKELGTFAG